MRRIPLFLAALATLAGPALAQELNGHSKPAAQEVDLSSMLRDLEVMRRILDREALSQKQATDADLSLFGAFASSNSEAFYLPGFGALFLAEVSYPVAPPAGQPASTEGEPTLWDQVRAEVDGRPGPGSLSSDYSAQPVDALKFAVLRTLARYGNNMKQIPDGESITVLIRGRAQTRFTSGMYSVNDLFTTNSGGQPVGVAGRLVGQVTDSGGRPISRGVVSTRMNHSSVMTVTLGMSQIRRLADRTLTSEELQEVATVLQY